jgi:hypothetical protein
MHAYSRGKLVVQAGTKIIVRKKDQDRADKIKKGAGASPLLWI